MHTRLFILLSFIFSLCLTAEQDFPVLYKGRFRPAEAYARLWLYENYHSPTLKKSDLAAFHTHTSSPIPLLWSLEIQGNASYQSAPLFWIRSAEVKQLIGLPLKKDRFTFQELNNSPALQLPPPEQIKNDKKLTEDWTGLQIALREFQQLHGAPSPSERAFHERFENLKAQSTDPKEIERLLEQDFPLIERLKNAGSLFRAIPARYPRGEWLTLQTLLIEVYDPKMNALKPIDNFTLYSNDQFKVIQQAFSILVKSMAKSTNSTSWQKQEIELGHLLEQAYHPLAGQLYQQAHGKGLYYPTVKQLKAETLYISYPWIPTLIFIYGLGACILIAAYRLHSKMGYHIAVGVIIFATLFHTALLAIRCYILGRPPVTNMFETVIYVPWVASCTAILFPLFRRNLFVLLAACLTSISLLVILEVTDLNQSLEQVQAVLDSQFWLLIHVLLVVGSYGIFFLGALLGHFYLGLYLIKRTETPTMKALGQLILQTMYGGTILLVSGTILGGIWAAESWGRFWDWDPKESWAFISSCFFLIWIHAYRFHRIGLFGLAIGAVSGLLAISFTWYGVNYILGTGLHSYGFGSGGEIFYYTFLGLECLFLILMLTIHFNRNTLNINHIDK